MDQLDPCSDISLHTRGHHVEIVEGAYDALAHAAALGSVRVHIIELWEPGRIFEIAELGEPVPPTWLRDAIRRPIASCVNTAGPRSACSGQSSADAVQEPSAGNPHITVLAETPHRRVVSCLG